MSLGTRLKELRRNARLTQRELAERAGVDFTYVSKMENDRPEHTPSFKTLHDMAAVLEVDELELMALANKVPTAFQSITGDREALRLFRRVAEWITTPEGRRDLNAYLDRRERDEGT